jgi:hypothetical protein
MEYTIIFLLSIIIFILFFIKEIKIIKQLSLNEINNKNNKKNKKDNIFNYEMIPIKKLTLMYYNPFLLKIYKCILDDIKQYKKYDPNSYIIFCQLDLSSSDLALLDWFGYVNGIIKLCIDTLIKLIKNKEKISVNFINKIELLNRYYDIYYKDNGYKKFMNKNLDKKYLDNKKLNNNIILQNLYKIYNKHRYIFSLIIKTSTDTKKNDLLKQIKKYINDDKNLYMLNAHLNNLDYKKIKNKKELFNNI